jgi:hypothetical protein
MVARSRRSKFAETGDDTMFTFPITRHQGDRPAARRLRTRRPLVEDLEGRLLLSGIQGRHIGTSVALAEKAYAQANLAGNVGNHIGMSVAPAIVGNHIGMSVAPAIVGNHIGTSVSGAAHAAVSSDGTYTVRFFE